MREFHARNRNMASDDLRMHQKICAIFRKIAIEPPGVEDHRSWRMRAMPVAGYAARSLLAMRLGYLMQLRDPLFELPEHPDEGRT